jgi:cytochrome b561
MTIPLPNINTLRWLHWSMALLVAGDDPVGAMVREGLPRGFTGSFISHKNLGVSFLLV